MIENQTARVAIGESFQIQGPYGEKRLPMTVHHIKPNEDRGARYDDKETIEAHTLVAFDTDTQRIETLAEVRISMGRSSSASVSYASVWLRCGDYSSGRGSAGGYGYCKASAATAEALEAAGWKTGLHGVGMRPMLDAIRSIVFEGIGLDAARYIGADWV